MLFSGGLKCFIRPTIRTTPMNSAKMEMNPYFRNLKNPLVAGGRLESGGGSVRELVDGKVGGLLDPVSVGGSLGGISMRNCSP